MAAKWTSKDVGNTPDFSELFKEEFAVLLLRGKNSFGDNIYSYVKVALPNIRRLYQSLNVGTSFNPSDFGEVVSAGTGEPSAEVKAEIAALYPMLNDSESANNNDNNSGNSSNSSSSDSKIKYKPIQKKSWDEY